MLYPGIVSATFSSLPPQEIIPAVRRASLRGIEWSSTAHVRPGDTETARLVRQMMDDQDLVSPSYGTYYYAGGEGNPDFRQIIENALILGAPVIRVWAGRIGTSSALTPRHREFITSDLRRICALAASCGLKVSTEYHPYSLTDTLDSTLQLLRDVPNLYTHWQADEGKTDHQKSLTELLPRLTVVHASRWVHGEQRPFSEAGTEWDSFLRCLKSRKEDRFVLLEFVRGGTVRQMEEDAAELIRRMERA